MKRLPFILLAFVIWMLIVWPFGPGWPQHIGVGVLVAIASGLVMRDVQVDALGKWLEPKRYFWLICYMFVLAYYIIKANLDVVYRVLHPDMPIWPGIVRVQTALTSPTAITVLANSVTLTPGTLSVNATEDGKLYVHWITVRSQDDDEAGEYITRRFEWFLRQIFE